MTEEQPINSDISIIMVIDKDKLPEELRDKFPLDLQQKLIELLQSGTCQQNQLNKDKESSLFAVQQGRVIGNIYKDNIVL